MLNIFFSGTSISVFLVCLAEAVIVLFFRFEPMPTERLAGAPHVARFIRQWLLIAPSVGKLGTIKLKSVFNDFFSLVGSLGVC